MEGHFYGNACDVEPACEPLDPPAHPDPAAGNATTAEAGAGDGVAEAGMFGPVRSYETLIAEAQEAIDSYTERTHGYLHSSEGGDSMARAVVDALLGVEHPGVGWYRAHTYIHRPGCDGTCMDEGECYACYYPDWQPPATAASGEG